jgi:drug/metabolite transporter (DMT)-like permease
MTRGRIREAAFLLVGCGVLLGATLPLQKLAASGGVPPASWVFVATCGASLLLLAATLATGRPPPARHLTYYGIAGLISFVIPNLVVFVVIPRIGAGLAGVMFALSPIVTLALSAAMSRRRPDLAGTLGLLLGLAGALAIIAFRGGGEAGSDAGPGWVLLALLIPLFLAAGNIYRSAKWPAGADPLALSAGANLAAAAMLAGAVLASGEGASGLAAVASVPLLIGGQIVLIGAMLALFFRLQQVGGPVYLSQIGYVAAAVGLVSGTLVLGERYPAATWLGALVVVAGVALVTWSQARSAR